MASSSATFIKGKELKKVDANKPSLTAMAVNDVKTITGKKMTMANVRSLCRARTGQVFTQRRSGRGVYVLTRIK